MKAFRNRSLHVFFSFFLTSDMFYVYYVLYIVYMYRSNINILDQTNSPSKATSLSPSTGWQGIFGTWKIKPTGLDA